MENIDKAEVNPAMTGKLTNVVKLESTVFGTGSYVNFSMTEYDHLETALAIYEQHAVENISYLRGSSGERFLNISENVLIRCENILGVSMRFFIEGFPHAIHPATLKDLLYSKNYSRMGYRIQISLRFGSLNSHVYTTSAWRDTKEEANELKERIYNLIQTMDTKTTVELFGLVIRPKSILSCEVMVSDTPEEKPWLDFIEEEE